MRSFLARHPVLAIIGGTLTMLAALVGIALFQYNRPIPELRVVDLPIGGSSPSTDASVDVPWPPNGSSALGVAGVETLGATKNQEQRAIASLVKVMTAYVILKEHPLARGQPGPEIELTAAHVSNYQARRANGESVVVVSAGARLTERDLLRGLMLASANNFADVLAEWHSGSVEAFVAAMNAEAQALGMNETHYADAAGLDPASVSTARDQLILANAAMLNDSLASLVAEVQATLPLAGVVYNTNALLGEEGIVGLKTGWTEEAGACFMFAARWPLEERNVLVIGVVLGQDTLADAFRVARQLIPVAGQSLSLLNLGKEGDVIGRVIADWGGSATALLGEDTQIVLLPGMELEATVELSDGTAVKDGADLGSLKLSAGDQRIAIPLKASGSVSGPGFLWRLTR